MQPLLLTVCGKTPRYGNACFIAPNATLAGDVCMGDECSVWFNAVLRGDVCSIVLGNRVNIQDGVVVHGTYQRSSTQLADEVSVGHRAIIHGCHIQSHVLVGMGAIVMDDVEIASHVIVAAGAVVTERMKLESGWIYAGTPAKKLKPLEELTRAEIERIAHNYVTYSQWFR